MKHLNLYDILRWQYWKFKCRFGYHSCWTGVLIGEKWYFRCVSCGYIDKTRDYRLEKYCICGDQLMTKEEESKGKCESCQIVKEVDKTYIEKTKIDICDCCGKLTENYNQKWECWLCKKCEFEYEQEDLT